MKTALIGISIIIVLTGVGASVENNNYSDKVVSVGEIQGNYQEFRTQYEMEMENCTIGEAISTEVVEDYSQEYAGDFELTAYTWTGNPCADGEYPRASHTVACNDPRLWHEWIYIEGYGTYYCHDRTGVSSNVIDIYMDDYDSCINFGRQYAKVYIVR